MSLNRIIVYKKNPEFEAICSEAHKHYNYEHNDVYVCIEVDSETLCLFKLKYRLWLFVGGSEGKPFYPDMPTYVLENFT